MDLWTHVLAFLSGTLVTNRGLWTLTFRHSSLAHGFMETLSDIPLWLNCFSHSTRSLKWLFVVRLPGALSH